MATERIYNVPLRKEFRKAPRHKRAKKAISALRAFISKHMKTPLENVKIGARLNDHVWERGIKNPPHHVKITVKKEEDVVKAELFGQVETKPQTKKAEKAEKKAKKETQKAKKTETKSKAKKTEKETKKAKKTEKETKKAKKKSTAKKETQKAKKTETKSKAKKSSKTEKKSKGSTKKSTKKGSKKSKK